MGRRPAYTTETCAKFSERPKADLLCQHSLKSLDPARFRCGTASFALQGPPVGYPLPKAAPKNGMYGPYMTIEISPKFEKRAKVSDADPFAGLI